MEELVHAFGAVSGSGVARSLLRRRGARCSQRWQSARGLHVLQFTGRDVSATAREARHDAHHDISCSSAHILELRS
jgi:hypothetical protein